MTVSNKITKLLALGTTSVALFGGMTAFNSTPSHAATSITFLKFKHNSYEYNKKGKRANKHVITKGESYYAKNGTVKIKGKKYYKLDGKKLYVRAKNVKARVLNKIIMLNKNSIVYNRKGKRISPKKILKAGDGYFLYGTKYINGKKYYRVGDNQYIKASNVDTPKHKKTTSSSNSVVSSQAQTSSNQQSVTSKPATSSNTSSSSTISSSQTSANTQKKQNTQKPAKTYSKNKIVFPANYFKLIQASNYQVTPEISKVNLEALSNCDFHSESATDDNMKIDSANLTPSQALEINSFALQLINAARAKVGSKPWYYSARAQHVANRVAYLYQEDGAGLETWHDVKALNEVDKEAGIHTAELMGGNYVNYEEDELKTMTDLKRAIYGDIVSMLFSNNELEHAKVLLTYNSIDNPTSYFGLSVSWQQHTSENRPQYSTHFIIY